MKKLYTLFFISFLSVTVLASNPYKLESDAISSAFDNATEVSLESFNNNALTLLGDEDPEITKTGFLLRAYFCGTCAMHRSYMGTEGMFIKYCWNPIGAVDFLYVLFKGDEAFEKYKNNDKWMVFTADK